VGDVGQFIVSLTREMPPIGSLRRPVPEEDFYSHRGPNGTTYYLGMVETPLYFFEKEPSENTILKDEFPEGKEIKYRPSGIPLTLKNKE
jgi:hypothetical protein